VHHATRRLAIVPVLLAAASAFADVDAQVGNGDKISGTLSPAAEVETFRVRVPKGATIKVKAKSAKKGPKLHIELFPPGAAILGSEEGTAPSITAPADESGLYAVTVRSQDGVTTGEYSLTISWKSKTLFKASPVLAAAASSTLPFAVDRGGTATVVVKPAKKSQAHGVLTKVTLPDDSTVAYAVTSAKFGLPLAGDYDVYFANYGAVEGGVAASVKIRLPRSVKRKINLTSKTIGSGNALGDAAIAALFDGGGGTLTFPVLPPGEPGSDISGSSVTVPQGALAVATAIVIATAPPIGVPDATLKAVSPTVYFGPEGLKFNSLDPDLTATLTIPYDPDFDGATGTFVVYTRDAKGKITAVPGPYVFDHVAHTVTFAASHFSSFGIGGKDPPALQLTLNTIAQLNDPRDVCKANDPATTGLRLRYFVAGGADRTVIGLRQGPAGGPLVTAEVYAGGGTDPSPGTPRLLFQFVDSVNSVFATQSGQIYIATTHQIFTVDAAGNVQVVAGTGQSGDSGDDGAATGATFTSIASILVASNGDIYVCDSGTHRVRKITVAQNNQITAFAGTGQAAFGADGFDILQTTFFGPLDMALDASETSLYVTDRGRVRQLKPGPAGGGGINQTIAGDTGGATGSTGDGGSLLAARFTGLWGISFYADPFHPGDTVLLVSDESDNTIRRLNMSTDTVDLIAGQHGQFGFGGDLDFENGLLNEPGPLITESNDITFVDSGNSRIRVQTPQH
jgi:hypothetical protein